MTYDSQAVYVSKVFNNTKKMIENHVVFLNNDVFTGKPSRTDPDFGKHPDQYSLCNSSWSSQDDALLSECYSNGGKGLSLKGLKLK